jgi:hypothetical protein
MPGTRTSSAKRKSLGTLQGRYTCDEVVDLAVVSKLTALNKIIPSPVHIIYIYIKRAHSMVPLIWKFPTKPW